MGSVCVCADGERVCAVTGGARGTQDRGGWRSIPCCHPELRSASHKKSKIKKYISRLQHEPSILELNLKPNT